MTPFSHPARIVLLLALLFASLGVALPAAPDQAVTLPAALQLTPVVTGVANLVQVTNAGDGSNRLFLVQQSGQILIYKNGSQLASPFLNIQGQVSNFTGGSGEQGLLSLVFSPDYLTSGNFYIAYTTNTGDPTYPYATTLARYRVSGANPDLADPASGTVLLNIPKRFSNHNGSMLAFGPDGYLYMSMGDGGSGGDPDNVAQNLHSLLGKMLRLDVTSTPAVGKTYVIPATNPFFGSADPDLKQEIWAYGLRNPWRFSFDRLTGDMYIADVGQDLQEEVNLQTSASLGGQNYGWRILEGNLCYNPSTGCVQPANYTPPVAVYDHGLNDSYGCSITGGYVYRGTASQSLQGVYFYGDYCTGKILGLFQNPNLTWTSGLITSGSYNISSFGEDEQGELYLVARNTGTIYQVSSTTHTISGSTGLSNVTLSYTDGTPRTVTTDGSGQYTLTVPYGWTGTITPSRQGYSFSPSIRAYTSLVADQVSQNYVARPEADTTGVFRPSNGLLYLKNANTSGYADVQITYGVSGDDPVTGDWNGDGIDTIGIYRDGVFYLRNTNTTGFADMVVPFGAPGDQPVAGDWDGDGTDTIGIYRPAIGTFFLRNTNTSGAPEMVFALGISGDVGLAGDWDGNGIDTTGVFRPANGALYLKNTNSTGFADIQINYGLPGDQPVTGDWNQDGVDTIGIFRAGTFYLRNSNTIGFADLSFGLGIAGDQPVAGNWDNLP